jgi:hypothetical protein
MFFSQKHVIFENKSRICLQKSLEKPRFCQIWIFFSFKKHVIFEKTNPDFVKILQKSIENPRFCQNFGKMFLSSHKRVIFENKNHAIFSKFWKNHAKTKYFSKRIMRRHQILSIKKKSYENPRPDFVKALSIFCNNEQPLTIFNKIWIEISLDLKSN